MDRNAELDPTLQGVLENYSLPKGLGRSVAERCFAAKFGSTLQRRGDALAPGGIALPWLLVAALVGALVGYVASNSQDSLTNQLMMAQLYGGPGWQRGAGFGILSGGILPASSATLRVIFLLFLILFITRSRAWEMIYPRRIPAGLVVARWLALLAALAGIARVASGFFIAFLLFSELFSSVRSSEGEFVVGIALLIDQIWWVAFWVAALTTLLVLVNLWLESYLRPRPSEMR